MFFKNSTTMYVWFVSDSQLLAMVGWWPLMKGKKPRPYEVCLMALLLKRVHSRFSSLQAKVLENSLFY